MLCPSVGPVARRNLERCEVPPRLTVLAAHDMIGLFDILMLWFLRDKVSHLIQACLESTVNEYPSGTGLCAIELSCKCRMCCIFWSSCVLYF